MSYTQPKPPAGSLWAVPPSHRNAPETSRAAAERVAPSAATLRAKVLAYIVECGENGATDDECQVSLAMPAHTQTARRWELAKAGQVVRTERRRPTRSGAGAVVWQAVDRGAE